MKKVLLAMTLLLMLSLSGCSRYPEYADDGTPWGQDWEMLGTAMGVEAPGNGLTLLENTVVLAAEDTHYATWTIGESQPYVNAAGEETELYPAQMYLLLYGCADAERAGDAVDEWIARERESYSVRETREAERNGQRYTILSYDVTSAANPYDRGASAFGVFGHYAVVVEFTGTADYDGDAEKVLSKFLDGCHYSAAALK